MSVVGISSVAKLVRSLTWRVVGLALCLLVLYLIARSPRQTPGSSSSNTRPPIISNTNRLSGYAGPSQLPSNNNYREPSYPPPATSSTPQKAGFQGVSINMVLDESGSMQPVADATIENFNRYIDGQKKSCGELTQKGDFGCSVSVTKFDAPQIIHLFNEVALENAPKLSRDNYRPNGGTNLLDAIGDVISRIDTRLSTMEDNAEVRPAILVVILTDGAENSSRFYNSATIREMISTRQNLGWTFVFLGANIDAWSTAASYGIPNSNAFNYHVQKQDSLFDSLAASSSNYINVQNSNKLSLKNKLSSVKSLYRASASASFFSNNDRANEYRS